MTKKSRSKSKGSKPKQQQPAVKTVAKMSKAMAELAVAAATRSVAGGASYKSPRNRLQFAHMVVDPEAVPPIPVPDGLGGASVSPVRQMTVTSTTPQKDAAGNFVVGVLAPLQATGFVFQNGTVPVGEYVHATLAPYREGVLEEATQALIGAQAAQGGDQMVHSVAVTTIPTSVAIPVRDGVYTTPSTISTGTALLTQGSIVASGAGNPVVQGVYPAAYNDYVIARGQMVVENMAASATLTVQFGIAGWNSTGSATISSQTQTYTTAVANRTVQEFTISCGIPSGSVGWNTPTLQFSMSSGSALVTFENCQIVYQAQSGGLPAAFNAYMPFSQWVGTNSHDLGSLQTFANTYRITAGSVRYTDLSTELSQGGMIAAAVIESNAGPGDTGVGSFQQLNAYQQGDVYRGEHKKGLYAIIPNVSLSNVKSFMSLDRSFAFDSPYLLMMAQIVLPSSSSTFAYQGRLIATAVYELKTDTQLIPTYKSFSDREIMEEVNNALREVPLIMENPLHWGAIKDFLGRVGSGIAGFGRKALGYLDKIAPVLSAVPGVIGNTARGYQTARGAEQMIESALGDVGMEGNE